MVYQAGLQKIFQSFLSFRLLAGMLLFCSLAYADHMDIPLSAPPNNTITDVEDQTFTFQVNHTGGPYVCALYIDSVLRRTNNNVYNHTWTNFTYNNLADANHSWYVNCQDPARPDDIDNSSTWYVRVDTRLPSITLRSPAGGYRSNSSTMNFNFTATDLAGLPLNCSLFIDNTINQTNYTTLLSTYTNFRVENLSESSHTWKVQCTDRANNLRISGTRSFTVDTPPNVTLISPVATHRTNTTSITFSFRAINGDSPTFACALYIDSALRASNASVLNNTQTNLTVANITNANHEWYVSCQENQAPTSVGQSATSNFTVDISTPLVGLASPVHNYISASPNLTFSFTANDTLSATLNCSLFINTVLNQSNASVINNTQTSFTVTDISDATYNWSVACFDLANNSATSPVRTFSVDTVNPAVTLLSPSPGATLNQTSLNLTFVASHPTPTNLNCSLYVDGQFNQTNTSVLLDTNTSFEISNVSDTTHTWSVDCTDSADETGSSATSNFTIGVIPPTLSLLYPDNDAYLASENLTLNISAVTYIGSALSCSLSFDGTLNQTNASVLNNTVTPFNVYNVSDGAHNWNVSCLDTASNSIASEIRNFTLNAQLPVVTLLAPLEGNITNISDVNFTFTVINSISSTFTCALMVDSVLAGLNTSVANNTETPFISYNLTEGNHTWSVDCQENQAPSQTGQSTSYSFLVDTENQTMIWEHPTHNYISANSTVEFNFTVIDAASDIFDCYIYFNGTLNQTKSNVRNNTVTNFTIANISDGEYNWTLGCIDLGNHNVSNAQVRTLFVETVPPTVTLVSPADEYVTDEQYPTFSFMFDHQGHVTGFCSLFIDNSVRQFASSVQAGSVTSFTPVYIGLGEHTWYTSCLDEANDSGTSEVRTITIAEPTLHPTHTPEKVRMIPSYTFSCDSNTVVLTVLENDTQQQTHAPLLGALVRLILVEPYLGQIGENHSNSSGQVTFSLDRLGRYGIYIAKSGYRSSSVFIDREFLCPELPASENTPEGPVQQAVQSTDSTDSSLEIIPPGVDTDVPAETVATSYADDFKEEDVPDTIPGQTGCIIIPFAAGLLLVLYSSQDRSDTY